MFRVESEERLLAAFRPRDRRVVELPRGLKFPLFVRHYFAWPEPSGQRVFLLFQAPGEDVLTGVAFRRDQSRSPEPAHQCDWCHTTGRSDQVGLLTADVNSRKRVGVGLCLDLGCAQRLEDAAYRSGRNARRATRELIERMARFTRDALGIRADNR